MSLTGKRSKPLALAEKARAYSLSDRRGVGLAAGAGRGSIGGPALEGPSVKWMEGGAPILAFFECCDTKARAKKPALVLVVRSKRDAEFARQAILGGVLVVRVVRLNFGGGS